MPIRTYCRLVGLFVSLVALGPPSGFGASISLLPTSQAVTIGQPVTVDIVVSGLGAFAPPALGTFDFDVSFDPTILSPTMVTFGSLLGDPLLEAVTGSTVLPGLVDLFEVSLLFDFELDALQPDNFSLATIAFDTVGFGTSSLVFSDVLLGNAFGSPLEATTEAASITVVPEPGTFLELGLALAILLGLEARRYPLPSARRWKAPSSSRT